MLMNEKGNFHVGFAFPEQQHKGKKIRPASKSYVENYV